LEEHLLHYDIEIKGLQNFKAPELHGTPDSRSTSTAIDLAPEHILHAFQTCEDILTPNFPGWVPAHEVKRLKRGQWLAESRGFYWMRSIPPFSSASNSKVGILAPQLTTLLDMRDTLLTLQHGDGEGEKKSTKTGISKEENEAVNAELVDLIRATAPNTLSIISSIPTINIPSFSSPSSLERRMGWRSAPHEGSGWILDPWRGNGQEAITVKQGLSPLEQWMKLGKASVWSDLAARKGGQ